MQLDLDSRYEILVRNPGRRSHGVVKAELDGVPVEPSAIPLAQDRQVHRMTVVLGVRTWESQPASPGSGGGLVPGT